MEPERGWREFRHSKLESQRVRYRTRGKARENRRNDFVDRASVVLNLGADLRNGPFPGRLTPHRCGIAPSSMGFLVGVRSVAATALAPSGRGSFRTLYERYLHPVQGR